MDLHARRRRQRIVRRVAPVVGLVILLVAWQLAVRGLNVPKYILPAPSDVLDRFLQDPGLIIGHLEFTATAAISGFILAIVAGSLLAVGIAYSSTLEGVLYPYLVITQVVPIVAVAPLLAIWLGFGMAPKVVVAFLIAFFPIVVNLVLGLKSPDRELINLMRSLNATEDETFRKVRVPYALPYLFAALRVAAPATVIGAIVAEFVGSDKGLGYVIQLAKGFLRIDLVFLAIFAAAALGITMFAVVVFVESRVLYWHESQNR